VCVCVFSVDIDQYFEKCLVFSVDIEQYFEKCLVLI